MKAPSTMLMGGVGTGKTTALTTYLDADLTLLVVITEPGGEESLLDAVARNKLPIDRLHYAYVPFARSDWDTFQQLIHNVHNMNFSDLANLKGIAKRNYRQMFALYEILNDFKCDRTGATLGPVDALDDTHALAIDSLSGLNAMCRTLVVGAKPAPSQGEWGVMMNVQTSIIDKLTSDLQCFLAVTAHVQKTYVESEGRTMLTPMCVTRSLGDSVPRMFSDVVMARREGDKFMWSTMQNNVDLKFRNLEPSDTLPPSFAPIVERYRQRKALVERDDKTPAQPAPSAREPSHTPPGKPATRG